MLVLDVQAHMDSLPTDILLLLPGWLEYTTVLSLPLVNKRWSTLFALPSELYVYLELWHREYFWECIKARLLLGRVESLAPSQGLLHSIWCESDSDWRLRYRSWWIKMHKQQIKRYFLTSSSKGWLLVRNDHPKVLKELSIESTIPIDDSYSLHRRSTKKSVHHRHTYTTEPYPNVTIVTGPFNGSNSVPKTLSPGAIESAYLGYIVKDVTRDPDGGWPSCSLGHEKGNVSLVIDSTGRWLRIACCKMGEDGYPRRDYIPIGCTEERHDIALYIVLNVCSVMWFDLREGSREGSELYAVLERAIAYVLNRLTALGITL